MSRQTQHRPQRDTEAREKADLKRENRTLRKQLIRMRRQLQKIVEAQGIVGHEAQDLAPVMAKKALCHVCQSPHLVRLIVPSGTLIACKDCKARKKEP